MALTRWSSFQAPESRTVLALDFIPALFPLCGKGTAVDGGEVEWQPFFGVIRGPETEILVQMIY